MFPYVATAAATLALMAVLDDENWPVVSLIETVDFSCMPSSVRRAGSPGGRRIGST